MGSKKRAQANAARQAEREALLQSKRSEARRKDLNRAGIVIGIVVPIITVLIIFLVLQQRGDDAAPEPTASATPTAEAVAEPQPTVAPADGWAASDIAPDPSLSEYRTWTATVTTTAGDLTLELDGAAAPQAVSSFISLAQDGYFDGTDCHRLTTGGIYVLQCGDPTGTGTGGPAYRFGPIENAPETDLYPAGTLAMARVGGNGESMGSQFFFVYDESQILSDAAGGYTVFGRVTEGLDTLVGIADAGTDTGEVDGAPATTVTITEVTVS